MGSSKAAPRSVVPQRSTLPHWKTLAKNLNHGTQLGSGMSHDLHQIYLSLFSIPVDVVVTPDDILAYGDNIGAIIGPALREGRELYAT